MGDMGMFSGLVRCGHCGSKMYLCRRYGYEGQDYYSCSKYRTERSACPRFNSIRSCVLEECISVSLLDMIHYVLDNEKIVTQDLLEKSKKDMDKETDRKKKTYAKNESRISKIDEIIKHLYLDKISGQLSDERFVKMSSEFEAEQARLKEENIALGEEIALAKDKEMDVSQFMKMVRKHAEDVELTPALLNDLIDHIEVFPRNKETKQREIVIHYRFIGPYQPK